MTIPGIPGAAVPLLVGREREQSVLRDHLAAALAGHGSLVLIGGEAGIGKTALADDLCRQANERGTLVLIGRCYDLTETPPYGPWVELFGQYRQTNDLPPLPAAFAHRGTVGEVTSQAALLRQVQDFLVALCARQSVVLLLDDLHWADPASLDLLRFLARSLTALPLLIIATYRVDELTRRHPLYAMLPVLVREAHAARLDLRPLDINALRALIAARYRLGPADTARLITYLQERAEGNPFFLGELLRTFEEEGILRVSDDDWVLGNLTHVRVPALLRQVIDARLARLGEEAQNLLSVAAVIGQDVPLGLWAAVTDGDEDLLLAVVDQATTAHVVDATADGAGFRFVHALIREALYEGILPMRRRLLHRRAGEVLAAFPQPDPDAVAFHFQKAGDARTVAWLAKGGIRAQRSSAFVTATARYEAALALMGRDGSHGEDRGWISYLLATMYYYTANEKGIAILNQVLHDATAAGDRALAAVARFQRGLLGSETYRASLDDMVAAIAVLETLPESDFARIRGYLGPKYSLNADRAALVRILANRACLTEAQPLAERLVAVGQDAQSYSYGTGAHALMVQTALRGDPVSARRWATAAHAALRASGMLIPLLALIRHEIEVVHLAYAADDPGAGARLLREAEATERQANETGLIGIFAATSLPMLLLEGAWSTVKERAEALLPKSYVGITGARWLAELAYCRGEHGAAGKYLAMVLPAGAETEPGEERFCEAVATHRIAARLALDRGNLPTVKEWLTRHDRWSAWCGAIPYQSGGQTLWAQYYRQLGAATNAREHAERALTLATEPRQPLNLLTAYRLLGELDTNARRFDSAHEHLNQSLALANACAAPYERALTLLSLAELFAATGNRAEAAALLEEVRTICMPLDAKPTLTRADALAARLTAPPVKPPAFPDGLSAREVVVLRLIGTGLNNQEIADALSLSIRTVERHITNIYGKIGARGRSDATVYALRYLS